MLKSQLLLGEVPVTRLGIETPEMPRAWVFLIYRASLINRFCSLVSSSIL